MKMGVRRCLELQFWPYQVIYQQRVNVVVLLVIMPRKVSVTRVKQFGWKISIVNLIFYFC